MAEGAERRATMMQAFDRTHSLIYLADGRVVSTRELKKFSHKQIQERWLLRVDDGSYGGSNFI